MNENENTNNTLNPFTELVNAKEMVFCVEYVSNGFNIYQAALKAGYSKNYAKSKSYLLMEKVGIKRLIRKLIKERNEKVFDSSIADEKEILEFWTQSMRGVLENPSALPYKDYLSSETKQLSFFDGEAAVPNGLSYSDRHKASVSLYEAIKKDKNSGNANIGITVTINADEDDGDEE